MCQLERRAEARAAARHEAVNGQIESFRAMYVKFRHGHKNHKEFFAVAVNSAQLMFQIHGPVYDVCY